MSTAPRSKGTLVRAALVVRVALSLVVAAGVAGAVPGEDAPLSWSSLIDQLLDFAQARVHGSIPVSPALGDRRLNSAISDRPGLVRASLNGRPSSLEGSWARSWTCGSRASPRARARRWWISSTACWTRGW